MPFVPPWLQPETEEDQLAQYGMLGGGGVNPQDQRSAAMQGLLATGLGILANNGTTPFGGTGQAIGRGGLQGLQQYNQSLNSNVANRQRAALGGMQALKLKRQMELQQQQEALRRQVSGALSGYPTGVLSDDEGNRMPAAPVDRQQLMGLLGQINPEAALTGALAPPKPGPPPIQIDLGNEKLLLDPVTRAVIERYQMGVNPTTQLTHGTPSASALLGAQTTLRGQDLSAETSRLGHDVTRRGQDVGAETARLGHAVTRRGQDVSAGTTRRGQDFTADLEKRKMKLKEGKPVGNITWD